MLLFILIPIASFLALGFVFWQFSKISFPVSPDQEFLKAVKSESQGFFYRYFTAVGGLFSVIFLGLFSLSYWSTLSYFVPFGFMTGGLFLALTVYAVFQIYYAGFVNGPALKSIFNPGFMILGFILFDVFLWYLTLETFYTFNTFLDVQAKSGEIILFFIFLAFGAGLNSFFVMIGLNLFAQSSVESSNLLSARESFSIQQAVYHPISVVQLFGKVFQKLIIPIADVYGSLVIIISAVGVLSLSAGLGIAGFLLVLMLLAGSVILAVFLQFFLKDAVSGKMALILFAGLNVLISLFLLHSFLIKNFYFLEAPLVFGIFMGLLFLYLSIEPLVVQTAGIRKTFFEKFIEFLKGFFRAGLLLFFIIFALVLSFVLGGGLYNFKDGFLSLGLAAAGYSVFAVFVFIKPIDLQRHQDSFYGYNLMLTVFAGALSLMALSEVIVWHGGPISFDLMNKEVNFGLFVGLACPYIFSSRMIEKTALNIKRIIIKAKSNLSVVEEGSKIIWRENLVQLLQLIVLTGAVVYFWKFSGIAGFLMGLMISGVLMSIMMHFSPMDLRSIPQYIEDGQFMAKGLFSHRTSVLENAFRDAAKTGLSIYLKMAVVLSCILFLLGSIF